MGATSGNDEKRRGDQGGGDKSEYNERCDRADRRRGNHSGYQAVMEAYFLLHAPPPPLPTSPNGGEGEKMNEGDHMELKRHVKVAIRLYYLEC